jgi:chromate reductase, NAD(P)H dehydrogenase (quinone)
VKDVCRKKKRTLRLRKDKALTLCMVKLLLRGHLYFTLLRIQIVMSKKKVLAICGSTRTQSANLSIIQFVSKLLEDEVEMEIYNELSALPHFNPDLDKDRAPDIVEVLRDKIKDADGVLICTPEYVFSLPGALKNAIEWCVSTTLFSEKPVALITASASGAKAHESLQLVMKTIYAEMTEETQLLIQGAKGKINNTGEIADALTAERLKKLADAFTRQLNKKIP